MAAARLGAAAAEVAGMREEVGGLRRRLTQRDAELARRLQVDKGQGLGGFQVSKTAGAVPRCLACRV